MGETTERLEAIEVAVDKLESSNHKGATPAPVPKETSNLPITRGQVRAVYAIASMLLGAMITSASLVWMAFDVAADQRHDRLELQRSVAANTKGTAEFKAWKEKHLEDDNENQMKVLEQLGEIREGMAALTALVQEMREDHR